MINRYYTLYCNNINNEDLYNFSQVLYNIDPSIKIDIVEINSNIGEASRGIPVIGISLFCHFITDKEVKYKTSATKIYREGLGYGINLLNIDLENYPKQFNIPNKIDLIKEVNNKLINSIKFCETYIDVKF